MQVMYCNQRAEVKHLMCDIIASVHLKSIATAQDNVEMDCLVYKIKLGTLFFCPAQPTESLTIL